MLSRRYIERIARFDAQYGPPEHTFSPSWHEHQTGPEHTFSPSWQADQQQVTANVDRTQSETADAVQSTVDPQA